MTSLTSSDPHRLGRYWLAGRLGAGGQGVVYEAYGEAGERVAVKVPRVDDPESRARLAKEAAATQRVASFCTAKVIEVAEPYIVSEFVPGPNLRQVIAEHGPYEGDTLRRLAIGVATALTAIHQAGVVHRDLKPDNIILGPDGPRVIDFGVAREIGPTTTGPVMGTPNYMAPEVLAGRGATAAADLWAWGLVVLFAARGEDAIAVRDPVAVVADVMDFRPAPGDLAGLADPLGPLVSAVLVREATDRPSARDVLLSLLGESDSLLGESDETGGDPLTRGGSLASPLRSTAEPDLGAIAEELYSELSEAEQATAPEVLLRMLDGDGSLRPVTRDELPETEAVDALLTFFGAAGLVRRTGDTYELAKPALVQAWPRLRTWVADNRDGLPVHRRLVEAARLWDGHGRKPGDLLHGSSLDRTLHWAATERKDLTLARKEREFLDAATRQSRRQSRRRGMIAAALAVLLATTLGGLGLAEYRRGVSERQRDDALARSLVLRAADLRDTSPRVSMMMSATAWRLAPLPESRGALYDSMSQITLDSFTDPAASADTSYALSPDGRTFLASVGGQVVFWDVPRHRRTRVLSGVGPVSKLALSYDGRTLAIQDERHVRLWDVFSGTPKGAPFAAGVLPTHADSLRFSPDGRRLFILQGIDRGRDGAWWDLETRRSLGMDAVSPDGALGVRYSTGGGRAELWDLRTRRRLPASWLPLKTQIQGAEFDPDGRELAVAVFRPEAEDGAGTSLLFRSVPSGKPLPGDNAGPIASAIAFNDRFIATWAAARLVVLRRSDGWVMADRHLHAPINELRFNGTALRILTDAGTVYTADVSWLSDSALVRRTPSEFARLAPGGGGLAVYSAGQARLWAGGKEVARPIDVGGQTGDGAVLSFSSDGSLLAVGGAATTRVTVLDARTGAVRTAFTLADKDAGGVAGMAFSPDGGTLAVAPARTEETAPVELWNLRNGSITRTTAPGSAGMAFRPDGKALVTASAPYLTIIDPVGGAPVGPGGVPGGTTAFSPDGRYAVISGSERMTLWDSAFTRAIASFPAVQGGAGIPIWSPDGNTIATYGTDERIRLWDVASRGFLGVVYDGLDWQGESANASIAFSRDGRTLYAATPEGVIKQFALDGDRALTEVCRRAGGTLSVADWRRYLPEIEQFDPCVTP
ncbi:WD40 repeat domain-containing serine/threonine-protein kinase [Nonomuraea guangzhouensis]|uniref:WD40 repeat domain-containing serine/threonine protein kinase n=1 Tax=Nonomuraea guangzhouensis TaxID=1291555 RepID=A0ABW4GW73_9ACTN|nr:WD40 repeat domain-containing serine/threonine-protein kinase [Nonomuraea guangzhouensis]